MRLWRLTRTGQTALDGAGTLEKGGRYSPPGVAVVNFASEAGLAVLVALRYVRRDPADAPDDYVLGWTEIDAIPERVRAADPLFRRRVRLCRTRPQTHSDRTKTEDRASKDPVADHHGREAAGSSTENALCPQRDSNPRYHLERVAT
jgi:RES domain-containing protein